MVDTGRVNNNATIFSKALYSNWCHYHTYNLMFDCGEGAATHIGNHLAGIDSIFVTHEHGDHTLGLPSIIGCRNAGRGMSRNKKTMDNNKPLTIYFPEDNNTMFDLIKFSYDRTKDWLRYDLRFIPIYAGYEKQLGKNIYLRAFNMKHQKKKSTFGYVIYEERTRLKKEFIGKNIKTLIGNGMDKDSLNETYRANLFAYCLDAYDIPDNKELAGCKEVIMDCTFINQADRDDTTHFTLDEAVDFCKHNGVGKMYAAHLSCRYNYKDVAEKYSDVHFITPNKLHNL
jgi:ribonuclease Z